MNLVEGIFSYKCQCCTW